MWLLSRVKFSPVLLIAVFFSLLITQSWTAAYHQKTIHDISAEDDDRQAKTTGDVTDQEIDQRLTTYEEDEREDLNNKNDVVREHQISIPVSFLISDRKKRGAHDSPSKWNHDIPVVFESTYLEYGVMYVNIFKRALKRISDHVCVSYHDVTDRWDSNNPTWFTENGFKSNAYLLVKGGTGCAAGSGQGDGTGPRNVVPCKGFNIITHEVLHTLGGAHVQQGPVRDNFITINTDNIDPKLLGTYQYTDTTEDTRFLNEYFDPLSSLMYGDKTWTQNGLETWTPIRDDIFDSDTPTSLDDLVFYELSQVYRCNEFFCKNSTTDCGPGYYTFVKGKCRCVCPEELDPDTNCQELVNKASRLSWPDTPLTLLAGGATPSCPAGFDPELGWLSFTGKWPTKQGAVPSLMPSSDKTIYFPICNKRVRSEESIDWESWPPGGAYCIIKPAGHSCGGAFGEFTFDFQSLAPVQYNGTLGDVTVVDSNVTLKLCCRYQEHWALPLELPNSDPFRLVAKGACPRVQGMRDYKGIVVLFTPTKSARGEVDPQYYIFTNELQIFQCYYLPPTYGCNSEITLTASTRSVTVTTPGFNNVREPNRRCLYAFKVPANAKVRLTFNTYDIYIEDKVLVKRYHKWQQPQRIDNSNWPKQIVSDKDYLFLEYWSSWDVVTKEKGINFTVDLLPAEESCYDVISRGEDYAGDIAISETYEPCLPWAQTTDCTDFPIDGLTSVLLLTADNKCRNPDGHLAQPWCFTYKNGTNCHKRYCDVCKNISPIDKLKNCSDLIRADKDFCKSGIQRFGCFKSCDFKQESRTRATCTPPTPPPDGELVGKVKTTYLEGEIVKVKCSSGGTWANDAMVCTNSGWTQLAYACDADVCKDKLGQAVCEQAMSLYPYFCESERFKRVAEDSCKKSCGFCGAGTACQAATSTSNTVTSSSSISPGKVMTFTCDTGYYHVSGNLAQACSSSGQLLGQGPLCQAQPTALDLNLNLVRKRKESLPKNLAVLLNHASYRIPFQGRISKWYYYCDTAGLVHFLIFRSTNGNYSYVGSNNVTCETGWPWSFQVPETDQINVRKDDIIGVYSPYKNTLSANDCRGAISEPMPNPFLFANNLNEVKNGQFSGQYCLVPAVGARLEPV